MKTDNILDAVRILSDAHERLERDHNISRALSHQGQFTVMRAMRHITQQERNVTWDNLQAVMARNIQHENPGMTSKEAERVAGLFIRQARHLADS